MTRAQLLTVAVLFACGCTESPVAPSSSLGGAVPPPPTVPGPAIISGTISIDGSVLPAAVSVRLESGVLVALVGPQAQRLGILDGDEVELRGAWTVADSPGRETDASLDPVRPTFAVDNFQVLAVGGRTAMDGVLGAEDGTYYLELSDGRQYWFESAPSDFESCLGKRVWVTGSMDDPPFMIGVIE